MRSNPGYLLKYFLLNYARKCHAENDKGDSTPSILTLLGYAIYVVMRQSTKKLWRFTSKQHMKTLQDFPVLNVIRNSMQNHIWKDILKVCKDYFSLLKKKNSSSILPKNKRNSLACASSLLRIGQAEFVCYHFFSYFRIFL